MHIQIAADMKVTFRYTDEEILRRLIMPIRLISAGGSRENKPVFGKGNMEP